MMFGICFMIIYCETGSMGRDGGIDETKITHVADC